MTRWWPPLAALVLVIVAVVMGLRGQERLSDHRGFHLVAVEDVVPKGPYERPRRVYVVLVDGLREDFARRLDAVKVVEAQGHCAEGIAAMPTLSMPAYAILSTGVEAERVGARANAEPVPIAAESIWEVARQAGLRVTGMSSVTWWQKLFPRGWDQYRVVPEGVDQFAATVADDNPGDLVLLHPVYVDEAGHKHGAASPEYAAAAERAGRELGELLAAIDWSKDTLILTADHGHVDRGGHGGTQPAVTHVLTCFAGKGVKPPTTEPPSPDWVPVGTVMPAEIEAPAPSHRDLTTDLAVLLGVRLPRNAMPPLAIYYRLDLPADYRTARSAELAEIRAKELAALEGVRPAARRVQTIRGLVASLVAVAALVFVRRRRLGTIPWMIAVAAAHVGLFVLERGSFDGTAVNTRGSFIAACVGVGLSVALAGIAVHYVLFRDFARTASDELLLGAFGLVVDVVHAVTFGWPMGYPLPRAQIMFMPFFLSSFTTIHAFVGGVLFVIRASRDGGASAEGAKDPAPRTRPATG